MDCNNLQHMKKEQEFNTWIRQCFNELYNGKVVVQRLETTTGNGVPDLLIITPTDTFLIESKFETKKLRPEQAAFHIKTNTICSEDNIKCLVMSAYPKTKTLVIAKYNCDSIQEDGIKPVKTHITNLSKDGIAMYLASLT